MMSTRAAAGWLSPRVLAVTALATYVAVSVVLFGLPIIGDFNHAYIGRGDAIGRADAALTSWFLAWWPYALTHKLNPLVSHLVWAPMGVDLAWTTTIPGASVPTLPMTLLFGPLVTYNVLTLLGPPLAAWTAFLLCRHITKAFWPSLVAGYVFGFSTYELGHLSGNLNLTLVFLVPLAVYLVLLHLDGILRPAVFLVLLTLMLVWQFTLSSEVFATFTVFGALAWCLALLVMPPEVKRTLRSTGKVIIAAYALTGLVLGPYLLYMFRDVPRNALLPPDTFSSDLLNFVVPTPITLIGATTAARIAHHFGGNLQEQVAYIGLPLLGIIGLYGLAHWRTPVGRLLLLFLALVGIATLGPMLHIGGRPTIALPWMLTLHLPLINNALPGRFMVYAFLTIAVIVAIWLKARETRAWTKWVLVPLGIVSLLPNSLFGQWQSRLDTPAFFAEKLYRSYLTPGENVLVIPYGSAGSSMLWQAQSGMYFRMAGGYVNPALPAEYARWPIVYTFYFGTLMPGHAAQLKAFLSAHGVTTIVVAPPSESSPQIVVTRGGSHELRVAQGIPRVADWPHQLFATLGVMPVRIGGVTLYRVPPSVLEGGDRLASLEVDRRASLAQWSALITAAHEYLSRGFGLPDLTPLKAEEQGLLPSYWGGFASRPNDDQERRFWTLNGLWLGPGPDHTVGVGMVGSYRALEPVIERYGPTARAIYFPAPRPWRKQTTGQGWLLMLFAQADIAHLAAP